MTHQGQASSRPPGEAAARRLFRPSMDGVHTWAGLLFGWLLYFMFVTGTVGYLDTEIDRWMRPELPQAQYSLPREETAQHALDFLQNQAPTAHRWTLQLPVDRNEPYLRVEWQPQGAGQATQSAWLDAQTGAPIAVRDTGGGQTLYQMHWRLHYLPQAVTDGVVAVASMALLLALLTGIVVHRRFFADFFTLRLGKGQRSWLDAHNMASVFTLPFQLMISYSGLVFVMFSFMPLIASAWYGPPPGAVRAFYGELFPPMAVAPATGERVAQAPIAGLLQQARSRWGGAQPAVLDIRHPGDSNARVSVIGNFAAGPVRSTDILVFDGVSGRVLAERPAWQSVPRASRDLLLGLHEGLFAGPIVRSMYVLSGFLGCAMIATGMVLWALKRRQRAERRRAATTSGLALVERLNAAVVLGLPIALVAYFWANRLLPVDMDQRAQYEVHVLFGVWLAMFAHAAWTAPGHAWRAQAWAAALGFGALPVLNLITTNRHLGHSLPAGDWAMAGFDMACLVLSFGFAGAAWALKSQRQRARSVRG
ncbi:PepSY-associated TM helix domain-containing protein [Ottowia sp. VDI28]|uniref:PepSY-associated TM helix domain-containing protein n=1 Tax=Ottowia sp. VDI28 TaxID=3133968 RepID=UPI003C2B84B1